MEDGKLVDEVIGAGGFAIVKRVKKKDDPNHANIHFAMKTMSKLQVSQQKSILPTMNEMFMLRDIQHEFLIDMKWAFQDEQYLYLIMKELKGKDLRFHILHYKLKDDLFLKAKQQDLELKKQELDYIRKNIPFNEDTSIAERKIVEPSSFTENQTSYPFFILFTLFLLSLIFIFSKNLFFSFKPIITEQLMNLKKEIKLEKISGILLQFQLFLIYEFKLIVLKAFDKYSFIKSLYPYPVQEQQKMLIQQRQNEKIENKKQIQNINNKGFLMAQLCLALNYLHSKEIIHRDIKPENILFEENGYLRITDLGIAKKFRINNSTDTSGTASYMAPEVHCRQNHNYAVDYYAVGIIAYELMLNKTFFVLQVQQTCYVGIQQNQFSCAECSCKEQRPYEDKIDKKGDYRGELIKNILQSQIQVIPPSRNPNMQPLLTPGKQEDKIINNQKYTLVAAPREWSVEGIDFINQCLKRKPTERLGYYNVNDVINHEWFKGIRFDILAKRKYKNIPFCQPHIQRSVSRQTVNKYLEEEIKRVESQIEDEKANREEMKKRQNQRQNNQKRDNLFQSYNDENNSANKDDENQDQQKLMNQLQMLQREEEELNSQKVRSIQHFFKSYYFDRERYELELKEIEKNKAILRGKQLSSYSTSSNQYYSPQNKENKIFNDSQHKNSTTLSPSRLSAKRFSEFNNNNNNNNNNKNFYYNKNINNNDDEAMNYDDEKIDFPLIRIEEYDDSDESNNVTPKYQQQQQQQLSQSNNNNISLQRSLNLNNRSSIINPQQIQTSYKNNQRSISAKHDSNLQTRHSNYDTSFSKNKQLDPIQNQILPIQENLQQKRKIESQEAKSKLLNSSQINITTAPPKPNKNIFQRPLNSIAENNQH